MNLDEALDRLGVRNFADEWGMSPIWEEAPFLYVKRSKRFFTYALSKTEAGYRLNKRKLKSGFNRDEQKKCNRIYGLVRRALSAALGGGLVKAAKLFRDGTIQDITKEQRGIWTARMRAIFYTGYAHESSGGRSCKFRVLIDRASFDRWLEGAPDETSTPPSTPSNEGGHASRKTPSSSLLERIARALATKAAEQGYVLLRDPLSKLVRQVLAGEGYNLSDRQFKNVLWNNIQPGKANKGGRRSQEGRSKFEADADALRAIVRQQVRGANDGSPKLIMEGQAQ
jgi:hypothetical protein